MPVALSREMLRDVGDRISPHVGLAAEEFANLSQCRERNRLRERVRHIVADKAEPTAALHRAIDPSLQHVERMSIRIDSGRMPWSLARRPGEERIGSPFVLWLTRASSKLRLTAQRFTSGHANSLGIGHAHIIIAKALRLKLEARAARAPLLRSSSLA